MHKIRNDKVKITIENEDILKSHETILMISMEINWMCSRGNGEFPKKLHCLGG